MTVRLVTSAAETKKKRRIIPKKSDKDCFAMADNLQTANGEEESTGASTTNKMRSLILSILSFLFFGAGVVIFGTVIFLLTREKCSDCKQSSSGKSLSIFAFLCIVFGFGLLAVYFKISKLCFNRPIAESVIVSAIPAEDLEKSPAPVLQHNYVSPCHLLMGSTSDLPDYLTAVRNIDGLYSAADAEIWSEDITTDLPDYFTAIRNINGLHSAAKAGIWSEDIPKTPPPRYERALEMPALAQSGFQRRSH